MTGPVMSEGYPCAGPGVGPVLTLVGIRVTVSPARLGWSVWMGSIPQRVRTAGILLGKCHALVVPLALHAPANTWAQNCAQ